MRILKVFFMLVFLLPVISVSAPLYNAQNLNRWAISEQLFIYIYNLIPEGSTILELGSGTGTHELARYFKVYSIESDFSWMNKFNSTYIFAPIRNYGDYRWYNRDYIKNSLPDKYDLIIVDGPPGRIGRMGFLYNLDLFNCNVPIIFDDINRKPELELCEKVADTLHRSYQSISGDDGKVFGVIFPYVN